MQELWQASEGPSPTAWPPDPPRALWCPPPPTPRFLPRPCVTLLPASLPLSLCTPGKPIGIDVFAAFFTNGTWWEQLPDSISAPLIQGSPVGNYVSATLLYLGDTTGALEGVPAVQRLLRFPNITVIASNNFTDYYELMRALTPRGEDATQYKRQVCVRVCVRGTSEQGVCGWLEAHLSSRECRPGTSLAMHPTFSPTSKLVCLPARPLSTHA